MKKCLKCENIFSSDDLTCPSCGHLTERLNELEAHAPEFAYSGGGFKSESFSELARLEKANFWFRARNELILWALRTYKRNTSKFLEVGCGTGFVLSAIGRNSPEIELSGSEIFLAGLSHAIKRVPAANFMQMDARKVPFVEEYDAIGAFDVLEHIEEDDLVLSQLHGALKTSGILLLTIPQHPWLWSASDEYACHVRRYTKSEIEQKVKRAGFNLLRSTSFVTSLLPAMLASRLFNKRKIAQFDPEAELKVNPILNEIFYGLMRLEIMGIQVGLNYPMGGSRLIIAKKV
jgi:SAM-dependent methyltransferase